VLPLPALLPVRFAVPVELFPHRLSPHLRIAIFSHASLPTESRDVPKLTLSESRSAAAQRFASAAPVTGQLLAPVGRFSRNCQEISRHPGSIRLLLFIPKGLL